MKYPQNALALATLLAAFTAQAAPKPDPLAPIHQFIDSLNTGDTKSALQAYAPGVISIIDEFPPYRWVGPQAAETWAADYNKNNAAGGSTDGHVSYGKPTRTEITAQAAYIVVPTTITFKINAKPMSEEGDLTFALTATESGWKIRSWAWSGVLPHPAKS